MVNGIQQDPIEGKSLVYSFDDADAKETHTVQYFEMFGNRAIYSDGWYRKNYSPTGMAAKTITAPGGRSVGALQLELKISACQTILRRATQTS